MESATLLTMRQHFRKILSLISAVRGFERDLGIMIVTNMLLMVLALATGSLTARLLGPAGRGELAQIQLWALFLYGLGNFDIPNALVYYTSIRPDDVGEFVAAAWAIMLPVGFFWVIAGQFLLSILLAQQSPLLLQAAQAFLITVPLAYLNMVNFALLGLKRFAPWSVIRLMGPAIYLFALVVIAILGVGTAVTAALGYMVMIVISAVAVVIIMVKQNIRLRIPRLKTMKELIQYGLKSLLGLGPDALNTRLDQLIIAAIMPSAKVGIYVVAVSWSLIMNGVFNALGTVLFPYIAGDQEPARQSRLLGLSIRMSIYAAVVIMLIMGVATPIILPLLFGSDFAAAVSTALILVVAAFFYNLKLVLANGLRGLGIPSRVALAEILALVLNMLCIAILLPRVGIIGSAVASLVAYSTAVLLMLFFSVVHLQVRLNELVMPKRSDITYVMDRLRKPRGEPEQLD